MVDNDSALLVGVDSLIGAEEGDLDTIDTGFSVGSSPDIIWVSDHVLPDGADLESQLGSSPGLAPQALGYRFNGAMTGTPDSDGGDVSVLAEKQTEPIPCSEYWSSLGPSRPCSVSASSRP